MEQPPISHAEFMEIFWFCDTHTPEELEELDRMPDAEAEQKDPMARRLEILSRLHEMLFGTRAGQCTLCDGDHPKPFGASLNTATISRLWSVSRPAAIMSPPPTPLPPSSRQRHVATPR